MGLLQTLGISKKDVTAQLAPALMNQGYNAGVFSYGGLYGSGNGAPFMDRYLALQVPSVARCRNLIAGVISSIDLELYKKSTGAELESPLWLEQPDMRQPRSVTIAYTVDSLLFYGVAYWRVTSLYADDGRPSGFEWVANTRVTVQTNQNGTEIESYSVNGVVTPMSGIGSLVTFQSLLPGVLETGARTIQSAIDVQKAASVAAATPMATGFIKNSGADLPEAQVSGILAAWKAARASRSTAFLTSTLDYQTVGFSPKDMLYTEASQYLATEIARLMNVPAYYISADMNNSMTYQNILDGRKEFVAYSLQPFISAIENRLSMDDITRHGNIVKFAIDETFLRADTAARLDAIEKMLSLGLIDLEQAQSMEQLSPMGLNEGATNDLNI
ncbi:portal_HK97, phage portal protein, HK97 family [uncultured Caudovirales phage]|uniref:Portal_HK97, phage portal protein, HK97 family n=1 Tax=uncultured Caudovirales phage TaxID=2100421 RepID=A0A6J5MJF3_9CAUD|nr:portal_HK97, phage portal protein, HK97 family [uncultured Caudovirales phage]CAB4189492.1 portal_HK97, phage portal protein, HK97 family [uncultured Caudovirales phage]